MSAIHLVNMVELGNPMFMSIALAITFELGSIVSFVAMSKSILKRLKKEALYVIFTILFLLQAFGNVYSSFDYIRRMLIVDPTWLASFREMFFNAMDVTSTKLTLACLIGLPIPLISLILLKSAIDYFSVDDEPEPAPAIPDTPKAEQPVTQFPETREVKSEAVKLEFDQQGNLKGAKTYDAPAVIAENAVMSAENGSGSDKPEMQLEKQPETTRMEPVVEPEPETKPEIPSAPVSAPEEPVRVQEAKPADQVEKEIAPNNYQEVQQVMGDQSQEKKS